MKCYQINQNYIEDNMTKENFIDIDEDDDDFGFSFASEDEVLSTNITYSSMSEEVEALKSRLRTLRKIFMPLLEKLVDEPDKVYIKWPNRKDIVDKQIKRLKDLTSV